MSEPDTPAWSVVLSQTDQSGLAYAHQQPADVEELKFLLAAAEKNNTAVVLGPPRRIPPKTNLTSLVYLDLRAFKKVLEYSVQDQVIHVETGITIGELREVLAPNNQWWPAYVPDEWTLLEVIHSAELGALEHRFGGVRDIVLGCTVVTANDSSVITCGGRVVKNVTGYDMTKLFVGSRGTLGAVVSAQLRLYALPHVSASLKWSFKNCSAALTHCRKLIQSGLPLSAVTILGPQWTVFAQASGMQEVVEEVLAAATALHSEAPNTILGDAETELWNQQTDSFSVADGTGAVQLSASTTTIEQIADALSANGTMQVRPLSGRVTLAKAELPEIVGMMSGFATASAPVVVAGADEKYNYVVKRLPEGNGRVRDQLQARIKDKFDPRGILNPLVLL